MQSSPYDTVLSADDVTIPKSSTDLPPLDEDWEQEPADWRPHEYRSYPFRLAHGSRPYAFREWYLCRHKGYRPYGKGRYPGHGGHRPQHQAKQDADLPDVTNRPLRLIHVGPNLLRAGAEQWFRDLLRFLDPRRIQVLRTIAVAPYAIDPDFVADLRIPVEVGCEDSVQRAARDCDILLSWGLGLDDLLGDVRPRLSVVVVHGEGAWNRDYLDGNRATVDHVVAVCHAVKLRNCAGYTTSVIYNGVDSARLAHTRSRENSRVELGFQPDDFVLGYVGRFSFEKRVQCLIDALAVLPAHFKGLFVGWGHDQEELQAYARQRIPGRHVFTTTWDYLGDYYQAMDAFCLVSAQEGFPLVLLEAMLCGRPLIVTPVGCVTELLRDRVNAVVVSGEPAAIAQAAALVQARPGWAASLAREAQAFAERYGHARRMARDYENLFHGLWSSKYGARA
jgi:glycosyltransferase involved in cell wall biosynthesis